MITGAPGPPCCTAIGRGVTTAVKPGSALVKPSNPVQSASTWETLSARLVMNELKGGMGHVPSPAHGMLPTEMSMLDSKCVSIVRPVWRS